MRRRNTDRPRDFLGPFLVGGNMITAVFTDNDDCARTYGLWQWDYGQQLRIEGLHLPTAVEIHFALQETGGEAITRVGTTKDGVTTVTIPDSVLEGNRATWTADKAYNIYAWVYLSDKSSGETIKRITMQVKSRPKPEAFEAPGDGEIFRQAIEAVNDAANRAEDAGDKAVVAADEAKAAATQTAEHLQAVQKLSEQVEINADTVAQDKQTVAGMLSQTQQAASDAALSAQEAKLSETAAVQAQAGAEAAEDGARQYAEETGADRQAVANDKQTVTQMREAVAADRQAVEQTALQFGQTSQDALTAIGQAQSTAVGAVKAEGNKQTTAVQEAGTQAVSEVAEAKTTAVQAVTTEGDKQTKRVEDAAAGIVADREQIAANKQAIAGKVDEQQGADNVGKALVVGKDGTVELGDAQMKTDPTLTQPGQAADAQVTGREIATLHQKKADAIVETAQGETMTLTDSSDKLFRGLRVFGKSTQDGTPSVEKPVPIVNAGEGGSITVEVTGRNLLKPNSYNTYYEFPLKANTVITLMTNGKPSQGGNIKFSATDGSNVWFSIDAGQTRVCRSIGNKDVKGFYDQLKVGGGLEYMFAVGDIKTYTPYVEPQSLTLQTPNGLPGVPVSKDGNYTDSNGQQWVCDEIDLGRGKYVQRVNNFVLNDKTPFSVDIGAKHENSILINISVTDASNFNTLGANSMLCDRLKACEWNIYSIDEVSCGYTGEANYLRVRLPISAGTEIEEIKNYLADKSFKILYIIATPIERDLTPEEIAAYKALHTNYPTTVISNDAGAHMEVAYVADTRNYIQNLEQRLSAKLVNIQSALISQKISGGGV